MNSTPPTGDYVLTNFRYLSAYNEVIARISQRQQTLTLFVAIFTGLVSALIATRDVFKGNQLSIVWLMVGFPCASITLTMLNYKYERLISILREYLADLERVGDAHLSLPSYNCSSHYVSRANRARHFHDLTCALLILAYNLVAIGLYHVIQQPSCVWVDIGVGAVGLMCVAAHFGLRKAHYVVTPA
jgi:hypothetical protein